MAEEELQQQQQLAKEKEHRQLLLDTLIRLWSHYLHAAEHEEASVKDHWLWLLLYNFQFLDDRALEETWLNSHFNLMPEELCSYLLEQVYQIISEAKRSQGSSPDQAPESETEPEQQDKCIKQLRKQHNLAQLILSTPSDCNKILALRTFLTDKLGHHLLAFLLRHIASQKSLCQLCINLFPNCKWSETNQPLQPLTGIAQFISSFYLNSQSKKVAARRQQQQQQQPPQKCQLWNHISSKNITNIEDFKRASKSSDELALLLIQLLTRCVDAEQESQLSVTVHNFALGHLCASASADLEDDDCSPRDNDEIIKFELLQLIAHCVNNFYVHEQQQPNVHDFNSNFSQLLYALRANQRCPMLAHGVLFIMFGTLHNLVDNGVKELNQIDVRNFDACFDVLQEAAATKTTTSSTAIFLHIYKMLLRLTDNLSRQEQHQQCLMESSTSTALTKQQQQHRHKRQRSSQLHCLGSSSLSCFFQCKLYQLLPSLDSELQEHSVRSLLRTGSCCCHYNAKNYATCLQLATRLSSTYQKCAYKFLHYNVLHTIFVKRAPQGCPSCEEKLKSPGFHLELLNVYKENYKRLLNTQSMLLFLKHLKHIAYLLSYDLAAGILAEVALPIFRQYKERSESEDKQRKDALKLAPLQIPSKLDNYRALHECLSIFVMYLSDIRLVKAFYNEENIRYMQDLLAIPELQRGVCDLIKVGIDNIAFLGENSQEQITLSRRLIQLQLNSSDQASQLFQALLQKCSKQTRSKFWLDESSDPLPQLAGHKPADILYITALQWTLNFELLKTSQFFYNEFAKIYSIPVEMLDNEDDDVMELSSEEQPERKLRRGDKNIFDILKLNHNALGCFLMLPKTAIGATSTAGTPTVTPTAVQGGICGSSSLETLVSHVYQLPPLGVSALSVSTTTAASSDYAESSLDYASVIDNYSRESSATPSFLQHLQQASEPDESIVLFDIHSHDHGLVRSGPQAEESIAANGLINKLFNIVGSLFGGVSSFSSSGSGRSDSQENLSIEADLYCLYEPNGECKKLLLKLFEATMAICIKGFQNEEGVCLTIVCLDK
ncbi:GL24810 [Drosophila persimilis]|uniref:GL24810 n=1 Tax=Drosophila persimilis TaxID=7234 RepID=B4GS44_DROPE|nr:GL24810 [Drosophila persimilis]